MTTTAKSLLRRPLLLAAAALAGAAGLRAQADAERSVPAPSVPRASKPAALTLFAFYGDASGALAQDAAYLDGLAAAYADRGLRVVVLMRDADEARTPVLRRAELVDDRGGQFAANLSPAGPDPRSRLVVADAQRAALFRGAPGCGVLDMLERELAGQGDSAYEAAAGRWRRQLADSFDELAGGDTLGLLEPLARRSPRDGLLNGLLYLTYATKANDRRAARALRTRATRAMSAAPRALAVFADLAMRGDPLRAEVWEDLRPALERAAELAPDDASVQRALLRARVAARDDRAAGRLAMQRRRSMTSTAHGCLDFATLLARAETPMVYRDIAEEAVARAATLGAEPRLLAAARYVVRLRCGEDVSGASQVLASYRAERGDYYRINSDAWRFLTQVGTMGRYDWFAAGLVEELLGGSAALDYFELDTAALAMFLVGRVTEAVDYQRAALREGGREEAAYRDRLARYEAFAAPGPR